MIQVSQREKERERKREARSELRRAKGADSPGAQASGAKPHEDGADELAKGGGVDRVQLLVLAVAHVVVIEGGARQAHALRRLVVVQEPLQLWDRRGARPGVRVRAGSPEGVVTLGKKKVLLEASKVLHGNLQLLMSSLSMVPSNMNSTQYKTSGSI